MWNGSTADLSDLCTTIVTAYEFDDKIIMMNHVTRREVRDFFIYSLQDHDS